ncbi:uncharacterized protein BN505_00288 [Alistipes sp. CAG:157]|nr:uncharacterized protein BN505_00288 [Alistipes sp. CAG:157]
MSDDRCARTVADDADFGHGAAELREPFGVLVEIGERFSVEFDEAVALPQSGLGRTASFDHLSDEEGIARRDETGILCEVVHRNHRCPERYRIAVAEHLDRIVLFEQQCDAQLAEVVVRFAVHRQDAVAVTETHLLPLGAEYVTVGHVARGEVTFAPFPTDADVDNQGEENVHQHAADHDEQALPGGFAPEFVRLGFALHLFGIHALVYHPGELDVSAERYPADSVTGTPAGERCDGTAKEELELFDAHSEDACEKEVSEFVYDYQQRKAEYELQYLDKYIHKRRPLSVRVLWLSARLCRYGKSNGVNPVKVYSFLRKPSAFFRGRSAVAFIVRMCGRRWGHSMADTMPRTSRSHAV